MKYLKYKHQSIFPLWGRVEHMNRILDIPSVLQKKDTMHALY